MLDLYIYICFICRMMALCRLNKNLGIKKLTKCDTFMSIESQFNCLLFVCYFLSKVLTFVYSSFSMIINLIARCHIKSPICTLKGGSLSYVCIMCVTNPILIYYKTNFPKAISCVSIMCVTNPILIYCKTNFPKAISCVSIMCVTNPILIYCKTNFPEAI